MRRGEDLVVILIFDVPEIEVEVAVVLNREMLCNGIARLPWQVHVRQARIGIDINRIDGTSICLQKAGKRQ